MKFTILRRITQIAVIGAFIAGNHYGVEILRGNLSSSTLFGKISLSDPFAVLQLLLAGGMLEATSLIGAAIILAFYALIAPRAFCGWVCPINLLTDIANWLRARLGITKSMINVSHRARYVIMGVVLVLSAAFGVAVFESVSHIGAFARALIALSASALNIALVVIIFEMFAGRHMICGHLCPLGAFWALASRFSLIRVRHSKDKCTACGRCKSVCPEVHVLNLVGKSDFNVGSECTTCGRCVEVCGDEALKFSILGGLK